MKHHRSQLAGSLLLLATIIAWACDSGASTKPAPTQTPTPNVVPETPTPAVNPTDDPGAIDAVADALNSGNAEVIRPLIGFGFSQASCVATPSQRGSGSGTSCGTPESVFFFGTCEGEYVPRAEIQRVLDVMASMNVYAIYRIPAEFRSIGQYSAVLIDQRPETMGLAWEAIVADGKIVALIYSCALSPEQLVELRGYAEAVVPPG